MKNLQEQRAAGVVQGKRAVAALAIALCAGGCNDPLRIVQEREGDLAIRRPLERLRTIGNLEMGAFKSVDAEAGMASEQRAEAALAAASAVGQAGVAEVRWDLPTVLALAVAHNADLQAAVFDPVIADEQLASERAKFDAVFRPSLDFQNTDQATTNRTVTATSKNVDGTLALDVPLRTGGSMRLQADPGWSSSDNQFITTPETYFLGLTASVSVPLMRGSGRELNSASIKIAGYQADIAATSTRLAVINILSQTERAYWNLVASRQELDVRVKQYELARAQLERAKRRVQAGEAPEIEITRAESGLASRLEAIIAAKTDLLTQQRLLKRLIGANETMATMNRKESPAPVVDDASVVIPTTEPVVTPYQLPAGELVKQAMENRGELLRAESQLLVDALNIDIARDATKAQFDVRANNSFSGVDAGVDEPVKNIINRRFQTWSIGFVGAIPLSNDAAEADLRAAVLRRFQSIATTESQRQTIRQEVLDAVDRVQSGWQRIVASQTAALLANRTLEAESRQFDAGLRTSTDVLDAASRLADAQSSEVRAIAAYRLSLVDLAQATGSVLGSANVTWQEQPTPELWGDRVSGLRSNPPEVPPLPRGIDPHEPLLPPDRTEPATHSSQPASGSQPE
jgi:outer membrane protein